MIRRPKFWLGVALAIALGVYQVHNVLAYMPQHLILILRA